MDYILGIMCDYDAEADIVTRFIIAHTPVDGVQAIGLGSRSIVRAHRQVNTFVPAGGIPYRPQCRLVVRIHPHCGFS